MLEKLQRNNTTAATSNKYFLKLKQFWDLKLNNDTTKFGLNHIAYHILTSKM